MKNRLVALRLGGGEMLVKRKRGKGAVLLAALLVGVALLTIPALAACPPGSILIDATGIGGIPPVAGPINLLPSTTYCVDQDVVLGTTWGSGNGTSLVLANNTRLVGAAGVKVTGDGTEPICVIQGSDAVLSDISLSAAGGEQNGVVVTPAGSASVIKNVRIEDSSAAATGFTGYFIDIKGGLDIVVQACTIRATKSAAGGILIGAGNSHHIIDNVCYVQSGASTAFSPIFSLGNGHQILRNSITNSTATIVAQIHVESTSTLVDRNIITLNAVGGVGSSAVGISVLNAITNITNNTINNTGGFAKSGNLVGIYVLGANVLVMGNSVTGCGTKNPNSKPDPYPSPYDEGDAILIDGANVTVEDNPTLQVGVAENITGDFACGVHVRKNAAGVNVLHNQNIDSATSGIRVDASNTHVSLNKITDSCTGAAIPTIIEPVGGIVVHSPGTESAPIDGNTILNVSQGNPTVRGSGSGIVLAFGSSNQYITNNVIKNAANNGIEVADAGSVSNHIVGNMVDHSTGNGFYIGVPAGNTLLKENTFTGNLNSGVFVTGKALSTEVVDNNFVNNGSKGSPPVAPDVSEALVVSGGADSTKVTGNTISTNVALGTNRGIRIESVRNVLVDGNIIKNATTGSSMTHGIVIEPGTSNDTISNNDIQGMSAAGIVINGGSSMLGKVLVEGNTLKSDTIGILFSGGASVNKANKINDCTGFKVEPGVVVTNHVFNGNCVVTGGKYAVQDSMTGTFDATGNYWGDVPPDPGKFAGRGTIDYSGYLSTCEGSPIPPPNCCTYQPGWNLISMPVVPTSAAIPAALQPYVSSDPNNNLFWHYDPAMGDYVIPTSVSESYGYWLRIGSSPVQICVQGSVPNTSQTITLSKQGWHQIGTYVTQAYWANTKVTYNGVTKKVAEAAAAGWISPIAYGWNPQTQNYFSANVLKVCQGYWVKTYEDNTVLTIPNNQAPPPPSSASSKEVSSTLMPPPPPLLSSLGSSTDGLLFGNDPNPVTDVHTTTFLVKGALASSVKAIKVQIFDLSGGLVYESDEVAGTSLDWHTDNDYGEYLANGVYLYKMYAKVEDSWIVSKVRFLAILR